MTADPRTSNHLTPLQEAVYAFLGTTNYFRTVHEIALAIGVADSTVAVVTSQLARLGLVLKRRRSYGFDAGVLEYKAKAANAEGVRTRRSRDLMWEVIGVEPLHVKLRRLLGVKRAREAERLL